MSISAGTVYVDVRPDMKQFSSALSSQTKGVASSFAGMAKSALAAFGGVFAASKVFDFLGSSVEAFQQSEAAARSLGQALETMGREVPVDTIENLANELQALTGIEDEAIMGGAELLATFGNISDELMLRLIPMMTDFAARFTEGNIHTSAIMLGKALNDPIKGLTSLGRAGVQFTETEKEAIAVMIDHGQVAKAQAIILDELARETEGAAEASATATDLMRARWNEFKEDVGRALMPVMSALIGAFTWMIDNFPLVATEAGLIVAALAAAHWQEIAIRILYLKDAVVALFTTMAAHPVILALAVVFGTLAFMINRSSKAEAAQQEELLALTQAAIKTGGAIDEMTALQAAATEASMNSTYSLGYNSRAVADSEAKWETFRTVLGEVRTAYMAGNVSGDEAASIIDRIAAELGITNREGKAFAEAWADYMGSSANATSKLRRSVNSFVELGKKGLAEFRETTRENIMGANTAFEALSDKAHITAGQLVRAFHRMRQQVMQYAANVKEISRLKFITPEVLAFLEEQGPAAVEAFADSTHAQQRRMVDDFSASSDKATNVANDIGTIHTRIDALPTSKTIDIYVRFHQLGLNPLGGDITSGLGGTGGGGGGGTTPGSTPERTAPGRTTGRVIVEDRTLDGIRVHDAHASRMARSRRP